MTISIQYTRSENSRAISAVVEFPSGDDADWKEAYSALQASIDCAFGDRSSLPLSTATEEVTQEAPILRDPVEGEPVHFTNCRVMFRPERKEGKKPQVRMRIGNGEQIPGQYVYAKSFDPSVMSELLLLRQGDMVDVRGHWDKPWPKTSGGQNEVQWDVIVESVERP